MNLIKMPEFRIRPDFFHYCLTIKRDSSKESINLKSPLTFSRWLKSKEPMQ